MHQNKSIRMQSDIAIMFTYIVLSFKQIGFYNGPNYKPTLNYAPYSPRHPPNPPSIYPLSYPTILPPKQNYDYLIY